MWPWIWGEMNQLHGRVDIGFGVKGTRGRGWMRFRSVRVGRMGKVGFFPFYAWRFGDEGLTLGIV